jgi:hypothetical protein
MPRELPLPPPSNNSSSSNDRRSPVPFMNHTPSSSSNTGDVRIPDIGGGGRAPAPSERVLMNPMLVDRSPVYRKSVVRSPIPTKQSPRMHHPPQQYYSPRQPTSNTNEYPAYNTNNYDSEPLRRTSVLYDRATNRTPPPPINNNNNNNNRASPYHHRHSSSSSGSTRQSATKKSSPVESSAADTLMSMAQKGYVSQKKRVLEMADSEEEDLEDKRPRLEKTTLYEDKDASIPVSS